MSDYNDPRCDDERRRLGFRKLHWTPERIDELNDLLAVLAEVEKGYPGFYISSLAEKLRTQRGDRMSFVAFLAGLQNDDARELEQWKIAGRAK